MIVVNDGSTDQTANIVEEYSDKLNIKLINLEDNAGVANARNIGIENASAKYIFFVDSDDAVGERYVEHLLSVEEAVDYVVIQHRRNDEEKN